MALLPCTMPVGFFFSFLSLAYDWGNRDANPYWKFKTLNLILSDLRDFAGNCGIKCLSHIPVRSWQPIRKNLEAKCWHFGKHQLKSCKRENLKIIPSVAFCKRQLWRHQESRVATLMRLSIKEDLIPRWLQVSTWKITLEGTTGWNREKEKQLHTNSKSWHQWEGHEVKGIFASLQPDRLWCTLWMTFTAYIHKTVPGTAFFSLPDTGEKYWHTFHCINMSFIHWPRKFLCLILSLLFIKLLIESLKDPFLLHPL